MHPSGSLSFYDEHDRCLQAYNPSLNSARAEDWMANVMVTELPDGDLKVFKEKGVTVKYLPKAGCDKWAKKLEPSNEKQLSRFEELGQKVKKIADDMNKKFHYVPDKGIT
jgi:hypothetical protein